MKEADEAGGQREGAGGCREWGSGSDMPTSGRAEEGGDRHGASSGEAWERDHRARASAGPWDRDRSKPWCPVGSADAVEELRDRNVEATSEAHENANAGVALGPLDAPHVKAY